MSKDQPYKTILLFGAPGVGKGTQGQILGSIPGFFHLSSGDLFRTIDVDSELGKIFYEYSSRGELVPDDITIRIWKEHMSTSTGQNAYNPHADFLVLDGIPRNVNQARLMDKHIHVLKVIPLVCEDLDTLIDRLRGRAVKENRADDAREEVIRRRWEVYQKETSPLLEYYPTSIISNVNAIGSPAEVIKRILEILVPLQKAHFGDVLD
jgi:adenylate kinase